MPCGRVSKLIRTRQRAPNRLRNLRGHRYFDARGYVQVAASLGRCPEEIERHNAQVEVRRLRMIEEAKRAASNADAAKVVQQGGKRGALGAMLAVAAVALGAGAGAPDAPPPPSKDPRRP